MKKLLTTTQITILIFLMVFLFLPGKINADNENYDPLIFTPQIKLPIQNSVFNQLSTKVGNYSDGIMTSDLLAKYIKALYDYGLMIGGILAAIVLMGGGILWLVSAGNDTKISQAKELIGGSVTGLVILFSSWILLNTVNPGLLEMKPIKTQVVNKMSYTSCCSYPDYTAKSSISKSDCEKNNGNYFEKGSVVSNETTGKGYCVDTGCCRCKIGGSWDTIWVSNSNCADIKNMGTKVLPDTCELACSAAAGSISWEINYSWGQFCNTSGSCAWTDGTPGGAGGAW